MESEIAGKSISGKVPEFGAIFMSNSITISECLRKNLFGLPADRGGFVKQVKSGMILFLFEYEKRQLHGVFEAASDGEINIVHSAYSSSGKQFPAQVRANRLWHCQPLAEHEFRRAIKENYFQKNKFHFGLSRDQVHRLLLLFESRKATVSQITSLGDMVDEREKKSSTRETEREEGELMKSESSGAELDIRVINEAELGLGDFIPLSSLENFDIEGCDFVSNVSNSPLLKPRLDSYISIEQQHMDLDHIDRYLVAKGLYADAPNQRMSVFSRLNMASKDTVNEKDGRSCVDKSVNEIMDDLQQRHESWRTVREVTEKRISVFSRLSKPSVVLASNNDSVATLPQKELAHKRRRLGISAAHKRVNERGRHAEDAWRSQKMAEEISVKCSFEMLKRKGYSEDRCASDAEQCSVYENQRQKKFMKPLSAESSDSKTITCEICSNADVISHDILAIKTNSGNIEEPSKDDKTDNKGKNLTVKV